MGEQVQIIWQPQPGPQTALIHCPVFEIFYGGARGGGKTDGMLGKFAIKASIYGEHCIGVFFRKTREDLREAIERSKQLYAPIGAHYQDQKHTWIFPNGARLKFQYLESDKDAENYQGHSYTDLFFEELTHWATPEPINKLKATLRSAAGVPCQFHATGNPGGPGHNWVKARYIDPAPNGFEILTEEFENPFTKEKVKLDRVFIPAKLSDNKLLTEGDPLYVAKLQQAGSEQLVKAWLAGDWSIVDGAFFDCWSSRLIIKPFEIPDYWTRFRSFDWGSAAPFSCGWWAFSPEDFVTPEGVFIPRNAIIRYREWYGAKGPNQGLKMVADEVAQGILEREVEHIDYSVADPAIFSEDGGPSIAERMSNHNVWFERADNRRVARNGAMSGWDQMRGRMKGFDGNPMIFCFDTCVDSIRTIPTLPHDPRRPEDLDTTSEDHAADDWRYACMSRPWNKPIENEKQNSKRRDYGANVEADEDSWKTV